MKNVGRSLGAVLVSGGLGGVMKAASRGMRAEGGLTVGILPRIIKGKPTLLSMSQ